MENFTVDAQLRAPGCCRRWVRAVRVPRIRVLIMGVRDRPIHQGGVHSGNPSGVDSAAPAAGGEVVVRNATTSSAGSTAAALVAGVPPESGTGLSAAGIYSGQGLVPITSPIQLVVVVSRARPMKPTASRRSLACSSGRWAMA